MSPLELNKYLYDIQKASELILSFTSGKSLDDYRGDDLLRSGVERQFEIIGEAVRKLIERDPSYRSEITDHRRIISFRNHLIHGYSDINDEVVWGIISNNLPKLLNEVLGLYQADETG